MRIINPEDEFSHGRAWWIGERFHCTKCGNVIEIERGDERGEYLRIPGQIAKSGERLTSRSVAVTCIKCGTETVYVPEG